MFFNQFRFGRAAGTQMATGGPESVRFRNPSLAFGRVFLSKGPGLGRHNCGLRKQRTRSLERVRCGFTRRIHVLFLTGGSVEQVVCHEHSLAVSNRLVLLQTRESLGKNRGIKMKASNPCLNLRHRGQTRTFRLSHNVTLRAEICPFRRRSVWEKKIWRFAKKILGRIRPLEEPPERRTAKSPAARHDFPVCRAFAALWTSYSRDHRNSPASPGRSLRRDGWPD